MRWPSQQAVLLALTLGMTNTKPMGSWLPCTGEWLPLGPGKLGGVTRCSEDGLPFTTSETLQFGSMLPICLGWAGLVLPSKIRAVGSKEGAAGRATEPALLSPLPRAPHSAPLIANASDPATLFSNLNPSNELRILH